MNTSDKEKNNDELIATGIAILLGVAICWWLFKPRKYKRNVHLQGLFEPSYEDLSLTELSDIYRTVSNDGNEDFAEYIHDIISYKCKNPNYGH